MTPLYFFTSRNRIVLPVSSSLSLSRDRIPGPGMDRDVAAHVFDPFFTTKANGTGLGLAIVRQAAEAHGGTVEVESALGRGATFRIRLPAAPVEAAAKAGTAP